MPRTKTIGPRRGAAALHAALGAAFALLAAAGTASAQGVPSLPIPGTGTGGLNAPQGAPLPPTKKLPNGECVAPGTTAYGAIRNFVPFVSLEDCLKSGGRPAKPGPAMGTPRAG